MTQEKYANSAIYPYMRKKRTKKKRVRYTYITDGSLSITGSGVARNF